MGYASNKKFIPKLKLKDVSIGSFDTFMEGSKEIIKEKLNIKKFVTTNDVDDFLNKLPYSYRASIAKNENNEYVGYIGVYDLDFKNNMASIILQTKTKLSDKEINEIINSYKGFLYNDLLIYSIKNLYILNEDEEISRHSCVHEINAEISSPYFEARYNRAG